MYVCYGIQSEDRTLPGTIGTVIHQLPIKCTCTNHWNCNAPASHKMYMHVINTCHISLQIDLFSVNMDEAPQVAVSCPRLRQGLRNTLAKMPKACGTAWDGVLGAGVTDVMLGVCCCV